MNTPLTGALAALALAGAHSSLSADTSRLEVGGGVIDLTIEPGDAGLSTEEIVEWVRNAARSVAAYFGRFPVERVAVRVRRIAGAKVRSGRTFGHRGAFITISLGDRVTKAALADDWMMTHEMTHLPFPSLARKHQWLEEGMATYVEPIARLRAGLLSPKQVWGDLLRDLHQGLPELGDRGLDHTHTWARTYWGGALFCLLADVQIRERTGNRKGLEDSLRAIMSAGGNVTRDWPIDRVLTIGDEATGVPVLRDLYDQMKEAPEPVDLPALWERLGVRTGDDGAVSFDDGAPLASVRKAIDAGDSR
ncbi:MAG: hypothetical protein ABI680_03215 [Chthoniobacteraceae bacterium]